MQKVISRKTIDQIEVGDVVGLIGEWLNFTDESDERLATVVGIQHAIEMPHRGTWLTSEIYEITCSDGHTYEISNSDRKYFIFETEVK
jgi:hypothetical protein